MQFRHNGLANVAYTDGHVGGNRPFELASGLEFYNIGYLAEYDDPFILTRAQISRIDDSYLSPEYRALKTASAGE